MLIRECRSEDIKILKMMASKKSEFNDPKSSYNPNSARFPIVDDDGTILGYIQGYDTFYVEEFFVNQDLPLKKRMEIFRFTVTQFFAIMRQMGRKVWWITKKDHIFANDTYSRNGAKSINYRKLKTWIYG